MASLEINAGILMDHGRQLMEEWADNLNLFYNEAANIKGLEYIDKIAGFDWTKLNFGFGKLGISGDGLERLLLERNIYIELYTGNLLMCMTGIGNSRKDIQALIGALKEISNSKEVISPDSNVDTTQNKQLSSFQRKQIFEIPKYKVRVPLLEAEGRVCASSIIPYPPGIPLVCPGEKFDIETLLYIKNLRDSKEKVIGVNEAGEILVGLNESL
jgi:lysine decarboxylase